MANVLTYEEIQQAAIPLLERHNLRAASLFGSYARGEAHADSDVDIIVYGNDDFRARDVFSFMEDFHQACNKPVDVFEISELLPGEFRNQALAEMRAL